MYIQEYNLKNTEDINNIISNFLFSTINVSNDPHIVNNVRIIPLIGLYGKIKQILFVSVDI